MSFSCWPSVEAWGGLPGGMGTKDVEHVFLVLFKMTFLLVGPSKKPFREDFFRGVPKQIHVLVVKNGS